MLVSREQDLREGAFIPSWTFKNSIKAIWSVLHPYLDKFLQLLLSSRLVSFLVLGFVTIEAGVHNACKILCHLVGLSCL